MDKSPFANGGCHTTSILSGEETKDNWHLFSGPNKWSSGPCTTTTSVPRADFPHPPYKQGGKYMFHSSSIV